MLKIADQTLPFQLQMTAIPMKIQSVHFQLQIFRISIGPGKILLHLMSSLKICLLKMKMR